MEEGTKSKKTVFVGGVADEVNETIVLETFSPFGESLSLAFHQELRCS
jgi:peptidyl-prolyl isomerase E (cyclophilin E)